MSDILSDKGHATLVALIVCFFLTLCILIVAVNMRLAANAPFDAGYEQKVEDIRDHPVTTWKKK